MAHDDFRQDVSDLGKAGAKMLKDFLAGAPVNADRVKVAERMVGAGIKIEHMDQIRDQSGVSNALRLASMMRDPEVREQYVREMQPKIVPSLGKPLGAKKITAGRNTTPDRGAGLAKALRDISDKVQEG